MSNLVQLLQNATTEDGYLVLWLADLLAKYKLGDEQDRITISEKLEKLGMEFDDIGDLHRSRAYFNAAADWYNTLKNLEKFAEMIVKIAEELVKEAEKLASNS